MKPSPLKRIRSAYGLRVVDIASAAGVSIDTVRRIDRLDVVTLRLGSLVKVAQALGVAATELVPGLARRPTSRRNEIDCRRSILPGDKPSRSQSSETNPE